MSDRESELVQNPYMRSFYKNPPVPASRPINTNRGPNPYQSDRGTRHIYDQSRLGTYSLHSEADMIHLGGRVSSDLVAAAIGPPPLQKSRPHPSTLGPNHRAQIADYYEPPQKSAKSNKRRYADRESSSELSEHEDDDFSPSLKRRLATTPTKQRKVQPSSERRKAQRYLSDDEYTEDLPDGSKEVDKDAEEEEALERLLAQLEAQGYSSPTNKISASKRRKPGTPTTPMNGVMYRASVPAYNSTTTLQKKPKGKPVPQNLKDADAADRMMWRWKTAGRPWEEIRDEYYRLSDTKPAASSLSVRYIKLCENLAANGFKDEIHDSFFETYPARKYLKTYTEPGVQEAALTRAVVDARNKTASTLWKEVVVQMKAITGEDFAAASLRRRYEELEKRQFFVSEQDPAKYDQWPALPRVNNGRRVAFDSTPELVPIAIGGFEMADHAHGQSRGSRNMSMDTTNDTLLTNTSAEDVDADYESFDTANGQIRSIIDSEDKLGNTKSKSHVATQKENESPSHTHPRITYGEVDCTPDMASNGARPMSEVPRTPTPVTITSRTLKATGIADGVSAGPRAGLVGYGDSDDSD